MVPLFATKTNYQLSGRRGDRENKTTHILTDEMMADNSGVQEITRK